MKRFAILILFVCMLTVGQVFAQDTQVVTLNDSNPSVEAAISLPPNTTGVVVLDVSLASVSLTDVSGNIVFSSADPRVHHLELSITPNSGDHTLTIKRLPGSTEAAVQMISQAELTPTSSTTFVSTGTLSLEQGRALPLTSASPNGQVALDIQPNTTGMLTATFPGAVVTSQVADSSGAILAVSQHDIDGYNLILDGGSYSLSVKADQLTRDITAGVSVTPTSGFNLLAAPQTAALISNPCTATVAATSVNLRSGPGTGYSVLDFGFLGDSYTVGGVNPESNWIVIGTNSGSAWMTRDGAQLSGDCASLNVYNIPLRDAQPAQIMVQPAPSGSSVGGSSGESGEDGGRSGEQSDGGDD
ncbi:MAG: SH3 domain-containing protein [Chloroflexota bacterium]